MVKSIKENILENFPTTIFLFIVPEESRDGSFHLHIMLSLTNFIDYNVNIRNSLFHILNENITPDYIFGESSYDIDLKVETLKFFKDMQN